MNRLRFLCSSMSCFSLGCLLLASLLVSDAQAQNLSITFDPPRPHDGEAVLVGVELPGMEVCDLEPSWSFTSVPTLRVDIQIRGECLASLPPGSTQSANFEVVLGPLLAGNYAVRIFGSGDLPLVVRPLKVGQQGTCVPSQSSLCLQRGRFRVRAIWNTGSDIGVAHAVHKTEESGYFTFFDRDNVELVVKILDGCNTFFNNYWLFTAGLTNLGVDLQVEDTATGHQRNVFNAPQTPYPTLLDTRALPVCP
jgi:hypothetical protein